MRRRVMISAILACLLILVTIGSASAYWWMEIEAGIDGHSYGVVYHEDAGETDTWSTANIYTLTPGAPGGSDATVTDGTGAFAGWMVFASGDNGGGAYINKMTFANPNPADGDVLFYVDCAGAMTFDWSNISFVCSVNGGNISGQDMNDNCQVWPSDNPGCQSPGQPPVPEIMTIVLVSIGFIALGIHVWYRHTRKTETSICAT